MGERQSVIDLRDVLAAVGFLTRLPVPVDGEWAATRGARSAWAYPLAGVLVGFALFFFVLISLTLGLPSPISAALGLAAVIFMTGALHEDGLADTMDGLWGGYERERRLEIMKDSRIGTYGVLALVLTVLITWLALTELVGSGALWALVVVPVASRAVMPVMMLLPQARPGGVSATVGQPPRVTAVIATIIGALSLYPLEWAGAAVGLVMASAAAIVGSLAMRKIGGQTGDIIGATQQLTQLAGWLTLVAML
ncbi:MAG: adenosylcobinamide-GDP ribazoletransferase [Pseudomonadota bacterium]